MTNQEFGRNTKRTCPYLAKYAVNERHNQKADLIALKKEIERNT